MGQAQDVRTGTSHLSIASRTQFKHLRPYQPNTGVKPCALTPVRSHLPSVFSASCVELS